jgi:hypothetical protein
VAVDHVHPGHTLDILAGAGVLYLLHPDGTAPVDADGSPVTVGDFTTEGSYYAGGGSISDLDGDGAREIIGAAWDTQKLCVFDRDGAPRPGFPVTVQDQMWSGVAVGDLDGDGTKELAFASRNDTPFGGRAMYVFRASGAEWMDGDSNPSTLGVFRVMNQNFNHGTPAIADLDGDGPKEIVYGSFDGNLYAWRSDGSNLPGFPVNLQAPMSASVAIGKLDGPSGPFSIVIPAANDSIYVIGADGGRRANFPRWVRTTGTNRTPSPALADMNGDGALDIVQTSTNGFVHVIGANGFFHPEWSGVRYSALTSYASECSPVVADLDGDGQHDVVAGDEDGWLAAVSGADRRMLPGFPIRLGAEATGTPALCDCDGDGLSEIVATDYGRSLYVWDYDFPFSPAGPPPWPQFHHDAERTGNASTPILLDAGRGVAEAPRAIELAAPRPNPARGPVRLAFGVPAADAGAPLEVAIHDLAGRRVRTLARGAARAGRHDAAWDLRDDRGGAVASGVYFARLAVGARGVVRKLVVVR